MLLLLLILMCGMCEFVCVLGYDLVMDAFDNGQEVMYVWK